MHENSQGIDADLTSENLIVDIVLDGILLLLAEHEVGKDLFGRGRARSHQGGRDGGRNESK